MEDKYRFGKKGIVRTKKIVLYFFDNNKFLLIK